jgi:hypothetical protein
MQTNTIWLLALSKASSPRIVHAPILWYLFYAIAVSKPTLIMSLNVVCLYSGVVYSPVMMWSLTVQIAKV